MKIIIHDHQNIAAIQKEFNAAFPYLKIEFLVKHTTETLAECRTVHNKGGIIIDPAVTVVEMEHKFREAYGIGIQIFRKSGKAWLGTTITGNWTLEQQNSEGEALSRGVR